MPKKKKWYPVAGMCGKCQDLMVTVRPRHFVSCKCNESSIDAGDEYYFRYNGLVAHLWKLRAPRKGQAMSWKKIK